MKKLKQEEFDALNHEGRVEYLQSRTLNVVDRIHTWVTLAGLLLLLSVGLEACSVIF